MLKKSIFFFILNILYAENRTVALDDLYQSNFKIKDKNFKVWLALNPKQQAEGLSCLDSDEIPFDCGMLFVYPFDALRKFWMRETNVNLDIAFIKKNGVVSDIFHMPKNSKEYFFSSEKVRYVLELREGIFDHIPLVVGDVIEIPKVVLDFSKS